MSLFPGQDFASYDIDVTFDEPSPARQSRRPTKIPSFNFDDYARRSDASLVGSAIGAMPPLGEFARAYGSPKIRRMPRLAEGMPAGFAALLRTFAKTGT